MTTATARPSLRERKKARLRLELTKAAVGLFQQQGFDATTVEQIASAVETSPRTFFRYFGTKEDVLFGDAPDRLEQFRATLAAADPDRPALEIVSDALTEAVLFVSIFDDPALEADIAAIWQSEAAPRRRYMEIVLEWEGAVAEFLGKRWGKDPACLECRLASQAMIAVIRVAIDQGPRGREHARAVARQGFALLSTGLDQLD